MNMIKRICPKCGHEIPTDALICPRCNRYCGPSENGNSNEDFQIWEGGSSSSQNRYASSKSSYSSQKIPVHDSVSDKEVCKCLGTIGGIACNTYYFVSSVKKHGGCARRDCSNSFENKPKIVFGNSEYSHNILTEDDYSLNIIFGFLGVATVIIGGLVENLIIAGLGGLSVLLAFLIPKQEKVEKILMKVNFRLISKHEIPTHAKDPWTQQKIIKSEKIPDTVKSQLKSNEFVDFNVDTKKKSTIQPSSVRSMTGDNVSQSIQLKSSISDSSPNIDFYVKKKLKSKLDKREITKEDYLQKLEDFGVKLSEQEKRILEKSEIQRHRVTISRSEISPEIDSLFEKLDEKLLNGELDKSQYIQKVRDLNISPQNESIIRLLQKYIKGDIDKREYLRKKKDIIKEGI